MLTGDSRKQFFRWLTSIPRRDISLIIVTHILPDRHFFLEALAERFEIWYIIPKPKSINQTVYNKLCTEYKFFQRTREAMQAFGTVEELIDSIQNDIIIIDIGWYFSSQIRQIKQKYGKKLIGVIEDTENWLQKYIPELDWSFGFVSVARSELKYAEDYHIGRSIVFSLDAILRQTNTLLNSLKVGVLWYGKIGKSVANALAEKYLHVNVYDVNPIKQTMAITHGHCGVTKHYLMQTSDIIISATGNKAINEDDLRVVKNGVMLGTVTSSDDELDIWTKYTDLLEEEVSPYIFRLPVEDFKKDIYILNKWNAINFIHGASVGNFIYLLQWELLESVYYLLSWKMQAEPWKIGTIPIETKMEIATTRLTHFSHTNL